LAGNAGGERSTLIGRLDDGCPLIGRLMASLASRRESVRVLGMTGGGMMVDASEQDV